jgi:ACS family tartrate transporter-like MFS transporter
MVIVGAHSDRTGERRWHVAIPAVVGALGLVAVGRASTPGMALVALSVAALGIWSALGPFWALPTTWLGGTAAAAGIALVNSLGNLGGFVGPWGIGVVRDVTGSFAGGLDALAVALVVAGALALAVGRRL